MVQPSAAEAAVRVRSLSFLRALTAVGRRAFYTAFRTAWTEVNLAPPWCSTRRATYMGPRPVAARSEAAHSFRFGRREGPGHSRRSMTSELSLTAPTRWAAWSSTDLETSTAQRSMAETGRRAAIMVAERCFGLSRKWLTAYAR